MSVIRSTLAAMPRVAKGHVEQLPSGSWRARVYAGVDPITQREIRLRATAKTEQQAYIELGRLLKQASEGRTPESGATMAKLLDEYAAIAPWDVSTRQTNEGFIRRTIKPALGHLQVRKVRGPILDKLYAELKRCGDLSCTGRPFTEHRNIPALVINPRDPRPAWQQVTDTLTEAIRSGFLASGDELPSITELVALQGIGTGVMRHALEALAADGLILVRRGQTAIVAGNPSSTPQRRSKAARAWPRLPQRWMPAARLSPDEGQHHPRHSQHPVRRVRCRPALGMDRPQPRRVSQAADHDPSAHPGHLAGRRRQGDRRGPRPQSRPGPVPVAGGGHWRAPRRAVRPADPRHRPGPRPCPRRLQLRRPRRSARPQGHQDPPGPLARHRPGHLRADRDLPGRDQGRARGCRRRVAR